MSDLLLRILDQIQDESLDEIKINEDFNEANEVI